MAEAESGADARESDVGSDPVPAPGTGLGAPSRADGFEPLGRGLLLVVLLGFLAIVSTLVAVGLVLEWRQRAVEEQVERIVVVEEPTSAAAYEMEINVLGAGLAVFKYVVSGDPQHLERVRKDEADFERFKAEYDRLTARPREKELGQEIQALHERYREVGRGLMELRNQRALLQEGVAARFAQIDEILDEGLQAGFEPGSAANHAKRAASWELESDVAEVGTWLGSYLATPEPPWRERIFDNLDDVRGHLAAFGRLPLDPAERRLAEELVELVERTADDIDRILALHDSLRENEMEFARLREQLDHLLDEGIQTASRQDLAAAHAEARHDIRTLRQGSLVLAGTSVLVCVLAGAVILRRSRRLQAAGQELETEIARRRTSEALRTTLFERLVSAQEEERGRIARELHDEMGQELSALMLGLDSLRRSFGAASPDGGGRARDVRKLEEIADRLIEDLHSIARELRPAALDDLGLHGALTNLVEEWTERSGLPVSLYSASENQRLPWQVETTLYRFVQEALTNVRKHAAARSVSIVVKGFPDHVRVVVEDDGRGFEVAKVLRSGPGAGGLGLLGMRERVALAGGTLEIESAPGRGTTLVARLPVEAHGASGAAA
jgi:signal transduction histidine kinase